MADGDDPHFRSRFGRHASLRNLLPWLGVSCILLGFGCGLGALVIGLVTNGLPQDSWNLPTGVVQPSVLLSVTVTLANAFLRAAFTEGVVIAWWVQAHKGASVATLYASYDHAYSFLGLFTSFISFGKIRVAALAMFLLLLDGPFLQRASYVQIELHTALAKLSVPVPPSPFVSGATAFITSHDAEDPDIYTPAFSQIAQGYNAREPVSIPRLEFPGTVTTDLVAPGFDVSCTNGSSSYRLMSSDEYANSISGECKNCSFPDDTQTMFEIDVAYERNSIAYHMAQFGILLKASYKSTPGGNGTLSWRNCTLHEAVMRYPLEIDNGTVKLRPMPLTENRTEYLVFREDEYGGTIATPSTIGGLWIALNYQYKTSANISTIPVPYRLKNENAIANQFFVGGDIKTTDVRWSDPIDTIIATAHELAFRTAISLNNSKSIQFSAESPTSAQPEIISQEVNATIVTPGPTYRTDFGWLISGFLMILMACLAVAPLYWEWWKLERSFTLNPVEVSKAFDAPLLRLGSTDIPLGAWPRDVKSMRIQYGIVAATEELLESNDSKDVGTSRVSSVPNGSVRKFRKIDQS